MAAKPLLVVRWYSATLPKRSYYIRGVNSDGRFYGTVRHFLPTGEQHVTIHGQMTPEELATILELTERIRARPRTAIAHNVSGVLAEGPIATAAVSEKSILYRRTPETKDSASDADFSQITTLIEKYIHAVES